MREHDRFAHQKTAEGIAMVTVPVATSSPTHNERYSSDSVP